MGTVAVISPDEVAKLIPPVVSQAQQLQVIDLEDHEMACSFLQLIATRKKQIGEAFDPIVSKAYETHKEAVAQRKRLLDPLETAERNVKGKVATFLAEKERERRAEEFRLAEEEKKKRESEALEQAAQLEAAGDKEMAAMVIQQAAEAPAPVVVLQSFVPRGVGVSTQKNWKFRIVNEALVPREFMSPDEKKIGAVVRSQKSLAKIPGVEIYPEDSVRVRA